MNNFVDIVMPAESADGYYMSRQKSKVDDFIYIDEEWYSKLLDSNTFYILGPKGSGKTYLLMAVNKEYGFAEYEYSKILAKTKSVMALEYMRQASRHGCPMAEYAIGKYFLERGGTEDALPYLESAASKYSWARFYLGLLYFYKLDDKEKGMEYLRMASEQNFEPARSAIRNINNGYNAKIVTGIFNLFYYASRIIDEDSEDMYPHPAFADVDIRAKKEDRAKRMGITMSGM